MNFNNSDFDRTKRLATGFFIVWALVVLSGLGLITWAAIHFLSKVW